MPISPELAGGLNSGLERFYDVFSKERGRQDALKQAALEAEMKRQAMEQQKLGARNQTAGGLLEHGYQNPQFDEVGQLTGAELNADYFKQKAENDPLKLMIATQGLRNAALEEELKRDALRERGKKAEQEAYEKTPKGRLEKGGVPLKERTAAIANALAQREKIEGLIAGKEKLNYIGKNTPLVGDFMAATPLEVHRKLMNEEVGRLQSQGAITNDELKSFDQMGPTPADFKDPKIVKLKLDEQKAWLETKAAALGFTPAELKEALGMGPKPGAAGGALTRAQKIQLLKGGN